MKRLLKWLGLILAGLVALLVVAIGTVYVIVGLDLSESHSVAGTEVAVPASAAEIAEGEPDTWLGPMVRGMLFFFQRSEGWNPFAAQAINHNAPRLRAGVARSTASTGSSG